MDTNFLKEIHRFGNIIDGMLPSSDKLKPSEWMCKYMRDPKDHRKPFSFKGREFLIPVVNSFAETGVSMKSSQLGATETFSRWGIWLPANFGKVTAIYTMPSATDVEHFSASRYSPLLDEMESLFPVKGEVNNTGLKQILQGMIYFRGTIGKTAAISIPADFLIHDEVDRSDLSRLSEYSSRLENSEYAWTRHFSTPTFSHYGIHRLLQSTNEQWWLSKCYRCSDWVCFEPKDMKRVGGKWEFVCPSCNRVVNKMEMKSQYVAKRPEKDNVGWVYNKILVNGFDAESIKKSESRYDQSIDSVQHVHNCVYGLPYDNPDLVPFDFSILNGALISGGRVDRTHGCLMGIDNSREKHVVIIEPISNHYKVIDAVICDSSDGVGIIKDLISRYNPSYCGIDPLPDITFAEIIRELINEVYYVWYRNVSSLINADDIEKTISLHKNLAVNKVSNMLKDGALIIGEWILDSHYDFLEHFNNVKGKRNDKGVVMYGNNQMPDHFAMATIYALSGEFANTHGRMMFDLSSFTLGG